MGEGARRAGEGKTFTQQIVKNLFTYLPIHLFTSKKIAFTLAEVLITLGVIGVVAAMAIPSLIEKHQKHVALNRLKKAYSVLTQTIKRAEYESGVSIRNWAEWEQGTEEVLKVYFLPYLDGAKVYPTQDQWRYAMCYDSESTLQNAKTANRVQYLWLDKVHISDPFAAKVTASIKLKDGTCIGLDKYPYSKGVIFIDVNGSNNKPNVAGKDLFIFDIDGKGSVVPKGYDWTQEKLTDKNTRSSCNKEALYGGMVCAAKIIADGWQIKDDYPW